MTAPVNPQACSPLAVDPVAIFRLRCEAHARLCLDGAVDLHDSVDALQDAAGGLVGSIGQDAVQEIIAGAIRREQEAQAMRAAARRDERSMEQIVADAMRQRPTPQSTIEALLYALRSGLSCFADPGNRDRLARCDEAAIRTIAGRLLTWPGVTDNGKPRPWLPAWTQEDVGRLLDIWRSTRGAS